MRFIKKPKESVVKPQAEDELITWFKARKNKQLRRLAAHLSKYEARLSVRQKKMMLAGFCLLMLCFTAHLFIQALGRSRSAPEGFMKIQTVTQPRDIRLPDSLNPELLRLLKERGEGKHPALDSINK